jgi:hypothetical protein
VEGEHQGSALVHQRSLTGLLSQQVQGISAGAEVQGRHPMAVFYRINFLLDRTAVPQNKKDSRMLYDFIVPI